MKGRETVTEAGIRKHLTGRNPEITMFEEIDSTNAYLKRAALDGAPSGSIAIADCQSAGRGRMGRKFQSPKGKGLYLSILLRPEVSVQALMRATGMAAVAAVRAVERAGGARPGIKWTNDLVLNDRKLGGILAETVMQGTETALIIGVGINVHHSEGDFGGEVADLATSLKLAGCKTGRDALAAALIEELLMLGDRLGSGTGDYVEAYRRRCVTLGRAARLLWTEGQERCFARDVDEDFGLVVERPDGSITTVRTGEVSVRGLYGYIE